MNPCEVVGRILAADYINGLKTEKANLEEIVAQLKARVNELDPILPTGFPILSMPYMDVKRQMDALGIEWINKDKFVPDMLFLYTDVASWQRLTPFLVQPASLYVEEGDDCDDYAKWASAQCSRLFKLNGCLEIWGDMPDGYHGFNAVIIGPGKFKLLEPNAGWEYAGELFDAQEHGYIPEAWR